MNSPPKFVKDYRCFLCGERGYKVLHEKDPFKAVKCRGCNLVYITPRLNSQSIINLYNENYWKSDRAKDYGYTNYLADAPLYLSTFKIRSRVIENYKKGPGRVLDVGCAAGFFLKVMSDKGWETHGIEVSETVAAYAREELGLANVRTGDTSKLANLPENYFDVITFWDVVEHLEDPISTLKAARLCLKDDGILIIETQNIESAFAVLLCSCWQHFKYEEHLYHFCPTTVRLLVEKSGFHVVENTPRFGGKKVSINFIIERIGKVHPLLSKLLSPLKIVGDKSIYLNFFDEMIVVAQKARANNHGQSSISTVSKP